MQGILRVMAACVAMLVSAPAVPGQIGRKSEADRELDQALQAFRLQLNPAGVKNLKGEQTIWQQRRDSLPADRRAAFTRERTREIWGHYHKVRKGTYESRRRDASFRRADDRMLAALQALLAKPALQNPDAVRRDQENWRAQRDECRLSLEQATALTVKRASDLETFCLQVDRIAAELAPPAPQPPPDPALPPSPTPESHNPLQDTGIRPPQEI